MKKKILSLMLSASLVFGSLCSAGVVYAEEPAVFSDEVEDVAQIIEQGSEDITEEDNTEEEGIQVLEEENAPEESFVEEDIIDETPDPFSDGEMSEFVDEEEEEILFLDEAEAVEEIPDGYLGVNAGSELPDSFTNDLWLQYDYLEMEIGATAKINPRRVEEAITNAISNDVEYPNFNYKIIRGDSVTIDSSNNRHAVVTAVKNGVTVVQVTYDAFTHSAGKVFPASDPVNTAYVIYSVGGNKDITITDNIVQKDSDKQNADDVVFRSYDTLYFASGNTVPFTLRASATGASKLVVKCNGITVQPNGNGTWTLPLENRSNIIELAATAEDGTVRSKFHVLDARKIKINVANKTNPEEPLKAGDTATISFTGVTMPVYKLATIYNPCMNAWGAKSTNVHYDCNGVTYEGHCSQWDLATKNSFDVELPKGGTYHFTNGRIYSEWWGQNLGYDKTTDEPGAPNLTAPIAKGEFSFMPDFSVEAEKVHRTEHYYVSIPSSAGVSSYKYIKPSDYFEGDYTYEMVGVDGKNEFLRITDEICVSVNSQFQKQECIITAKDVDGNEVESITLEINGFSVKAKLLNSDEFYPDGANNYIYVYSEEDTEEIAAHFSLEAFLDGEKLEELPEGMSWNYYTSGTSQTSTVENDSVTLKKEYGTTYIYPYLAFEPGQQYYQGAYDSYKITVYPRRMQFAQKVFKAAMPESGYLPGPISFPWQDEYYYANACSLKCLDPEVADVSVSGSNISVVPKKTGAARVIAQWNKDKSNYTTFQINVLGVSVSAADDSENKYIYIDPADETVVPQLQLKAEGTKRSETFTWSSSDETVATVDENGLVTGHREGPVTIYATSSLSTEETVVKGAIRLQVMENRKPYLANMSFYNANMFEGWTGKDSEFHAAKHEYDIQIKTNNNTLSVFRVTPYFDEERFDAVLSTQTYGGDYSETVLENGIEVNKTNALEPGMNVIYVDVTDKEDDKNTTRYTFNVFRPYTTTNTITRMAVLPNGQTALSYPKYKNYVEGNIFKYDAATDTLGNSGFSSNTYEYKLFVFEERTNNIVFTPTFGNAYEHVYLTKDDEESQIQTNNWPCTPQKLNEDGITTFKFGVMSDQAYAQAKQQAEAEGTEFVFTPEKTYTFYVEKVSPLGIDAKILSAELNGAEFYKPGFTPETYSLSALMNSDTTECTMKFTVPEGIEVFKGSMTDANKLEGTKTEETPEGVLTYEITVPAGAVSTNVTINLRKWNEEGTESGASAYTCSFKTRGPKDAIPDSVEGYLCVGSQYTNMGSYGLTPERTLVNGGSVLSVGGFGGYITWKYDKPIENSKNNPFGIDFIVYGNPFAASQGAAEPGNVMVSQDGENWYYLAGSMHYDDEADWNYSVTYTNNAGQSSWTDNRGNSGTNYKFPEKNLYPYYNWTEDQQSVTVNGLKLVSNAKDPYGSASAAFPDFGYVDINLVGNNRGVASNPYAGSHLAGGDGFDIDWAVDANGMPVHLDSISYIRVSTASHIYAGAIGEKSTEVTHAYRVLNPSETAVGTTDAPVSVTVDGTEVSFDSQVATAIYAGDGLEVKVDAPEGTNVYINGSYGHERTYETAPEKRIIRIITQEGEKEPDIRYIRLVRSDEVRGLTLSAEELKLNETETAVLTAAIIPENAANKNVIWTSSDENVATVAANGKVTAVKAGTAIITCTSEEKADVFAECIVTVSSLPVPTEPVLPTAKSITLNTASLSLHYGKTAKLQVTVKPDNAKNKKVVWSSSDVNIASVNDDGKVTATGVGTAIITCTSVDNKNVKAVCKVTVKDNTFMKLKGTAYTTSAKLKWTKIESADGYEVYGSKCGSDVKKIKTIKNKNTLSWTHSNLKKGTSYKYIVKAYKLVGGKKNYYKKSYSVHLTTKGGKYTNAKKVTVSADKITLTVGKSKKLTAKVSKVDSSKKIIKHANVINWKSTDTKIAKVSSDGRIQAVGKGTCSVYAYAGNGVYAKVKVTVK